MSDLRTMGDHPRDAHRLRFDLMLTVAQRDKLAAAATAAGRSMTDQLRALVDALPAPP